VKSTYTTQIVLDSFTGWPTEPTSTPNPSTDGRCGPDFGGTTCEGTSYGDCCSIYGWCGSESSSCGHLVCDPEHGTCDPVPEEPPVSQNGACGPPSFIGATCAGSTFGDCCNWSGECGSGTAYCAPESCDPDYGDCGGSGPPVSTDGTCGANGHTCAGSTFGGCCSQYGYCGDASAFCGTGCQTAFGICDMSGPPVSTDGTCSANSTPEGATCAASGFGDCCSEYGYCGATNAYCGAGCQAAFGTYAGHWVKPTSAMVTRRGSTVVLPM
jgi:hypothetical protein